MDPSPAPAPVVARRAVKPAGPYVPAIGPKLRVVLYFVFGLFAFLAVTALNYVRRPNPFAQSQNPLLQWVNNPMVKAKPDFHKQTFLKPFHKTAEFCAPCHKVSLPVELNHYKDFLRGQNHYDSFLLSGVSGHGVRSFYYPPTAKTNCAECHMPLSPSTDFAAKDFDGTGIRKTHNHRQEWVTSTVGVALDPKQPKEQRVGACATLAVGLASVKGPKLAAIREGITKLRAGFHAEGDAEMKAALAATLSAFHRESHTTYKPDEIARSNSTRLYREKNPAANYAARDRVIYPTTAAHRDAIVKTGNLP
jgi:hypothetical protein